MDELPDEVLEQVLSYLSPSDRLDCALTCRRLAHVMSSPRLLKGIRLTIEGPYELQEVEAAVIAGDRRYSHLRILAVNLLKYNADFWRKIARHLRKLELVACSWTSDVFYKILFECSKLEYLRISDIDDGYKGVFLTMKYFELPVGAHAEQIKESLRSIRHLSLTMKLTYDVLEHLLKLMPGVESISLSRIEEWSTATHNLRSMLKPDRKITELDLRWGLNDEDVTPLFKASSPNLEKLIWKCYFWPRGASEELLRCTKLRVLWLGVAYHFNDVHLNRLLQSNRGLESLKLNHIDESLTDEGFARIHELTELRELRINQSRTITKDFLCSLGDIRSLAELDLCGTEVDVRVLRNLACLPNLQTLHIDRISGSIAECIEFIFEKFTNIETLSLGNCEELTDADGVNSIFKTLKVCNLRRLRQLWFHQGNHDRIYRLAGDTRSQTSRLVIAKFAKGYGASRMEFLSLNMYPLTEVSIAIIANLHNRLKMLRLEYCNSITDADLVSLLRRLPLLEKVWLDGMRVNGEFLGPLEGLCPRLRVLRLWQCFELSFHAVEVFMARRPSVEVIPRGASRAQRYLRIDEILFRTTWADLASSP